MIEVVRKKNPLDPLDPLDKRSPGGSTCKGYGWREDSSHFPPDLRTGTTEESGIGVTDESPLVTDCMAEDVY